MENNILGLIHDYLNTEKPQEIIKILDDVFEQNGLTRQENKYKVYWTIVDEMDEYEFIMIEYDYHNRSFASILERETFISGINVCFGEFSSGEGYGPRVFIAFSKEGLTRKLEIFCQENDILPNNTTEDSYEEEED